MQRMNRLLGLLIGLWGVMSLGAQNNDAKSFLDRVAANFRQAGGVEIRFTVHAPEGDSEGQIRLKGEKFLLETEGMKTWFDGRIQWTYLEANDEVNISEPTAEELQSINPYAWLSLYQSGYTLQMASEDRVVMTAADSQRDLQRLELQVEPRTERPSSLRMRWRGNAEDAVVHIRHYVTGKDYPDTLFTFDRKAYPTAEMIDLR